MFALTCRTYGRDVALCLEPSELRRRRCYLGLSRNGEVSAGSGIVTFGEHGLLEQFTSFGFAHRSGILSAHI